MNKSIPPLPFVLLRAGPYIQNLLPFANNSLVTHEEMPYDEAQKRQKRP